MTDATIPEPLGAGINLARTDQHLPVTLHGTVWALPELSPQYPLRIGITFILALITAPLIALATSLAVLHPIPM